jgi:hypothetical protein
VALTVVAATTPFDPAPLAAKLADSLRSAGLAEPHVSVAVVDTLQRSGLSQKLRMFVPLDTEMTT